MKYIALLYGEPDAGPAPGTPEFMEMLGEFQSATAAMADAGILVDSSPLQPPQTATTVRAILDTLNASSQLTRWPQLHIARGALLAQCGRREDAAAAYRDALALEPAEPVRRHIAGQLAVLGAAHVPTEET
jgi:hypothetical protein